MSTTRTRRRPYSARTRPQRPTFSQELVLVVPNEAEIVEAELLEDNAPDISTNKALMKEALDALFSEDGSRLVPPPLAAVSPLHAVGPATEQQKRRAELLAMVNQVVQDHAQSKATGASYGSHLRAWRAWCAEENEPELPFDPQRVMEFIVYYAFERDEEGQAVRDDDGGLIPVVKANTVSQRLAALNKAAEYLGLPQPGKNPGVRLLMQGLRRLIGTGRRYEKDALDLARLEKCIAATSGATYHDVRARAAVLMRARTGATTGQLHRLHWTDIAPERSDQSQDLWQGPAVGLKITLAPTHRYGKPRTVTVRPHRNADLCLFEELRSLRQFGNRTTAEVFAHPEASEGLSGKPLTRQALHLIVLQAVGDASWDDLPTMNDRALATVLAEHKPADPLIQVRNTALLLTGFYTALRRSNLAALRWRDIEDQGKDPREGGVTVSVYKTKTDQEGTHKVKWLPQMPLTAHNTCPATAMRAWKAALTQALGRSPRPDEPVFVSLHRSGSLKRSKSGELLGISGEDICDTVQQLTFAAGLDKAPKKSVKKSKSSTGEREAARGKSNKRKAPHRRKYGAHSLRVGYVTECLTDDKLSIATVQAVTDHKSVGVLLDYHRRVNSAKRNPSRLLVNILAGDEEAVTGAE